MFSYLAHKRDCKIKQNERAAKIANLPSSYHSAISPDEKNILSTPIGTTAERVRNKEWQPIDILRAYGKKTVRAHEATNCITELMIDEAEGWLKEGSINLDGPLAGVPISMKDTVAVKGVDYCMGYSKLIHKPATMDSPLTRILKDAGAIPYVKTNIPITLLSFESTNDVFGRTMNPHNKDYSPGGSTGGESALLAYGGSRIGIGTDVAGSVRIPAHFSGIYTVRCSTGRFSKSMNTSCMPGQEGVMAVYSPMARTLEDLTYFFRSYFSMKPWEYDHHVHPIPWREEEYEKGKGKVRWGVYRDDGVVTPSPACMRALDMVIDALRAEGDEVVELSGEPSSYKGLQLAAKLLNSDGGNTFSRFFRSFFEYNDAGVANMTRWFKTPWIIKKIYALFVRYVYRDEIWAGLLEDWSERTTEDQWKLVTQREIYRYEWHEWWKKQGVDLILSVPNATPAVPKDGMKNSVSSCGYTFLFNLLDYAAGTLPVTHVDAAKDALPSTFNIKKLNGVARGAYLNYDAAKMHGLPVGVQVVGRRLEEEKVLGAMERIEGALEKKGEKYDLLEVD